MELREVIMDLRARSRLSLSAIVETAVERGIPVTWESLREIARYAPHELTTITPSFVAEFIGTYAGQRSPRTILDPLAGVGSTLGPVLAHCRNAKGTGITPEAGELSAARFAAADLPIEWIHADPDDVLSSLGVYDVVTSSSLWQRRSTSWGVPWAQPDKLKITASDDVLHSGQYRILLESAQHLRSDGIGIFLVANSFLSCRDKNGVREALQKLGLYLNAVIGLQPGAFLPYTAIALNIVFISRTKTEELFLCFGS
jgi:hypothetical protein